MYKKNLRRKAFKGRVTRLPEFVNKEKLLVQNKNGTGASDALFAIYVPRFCDNINFKYTFVSNSLRKRLCALFFNFSKFINISRDTIFGSGL